MIAFYSDEDVEEPRLRKKLIRTWIEEVAESYDRRVGELCYQFCGDERILQTNQDFLDHDYYTDIITFDESEGDKVSGDMLISLDTVRSNAEQLGTSYEEELHRVIIHGVLHLCGLKDKTPEDETAMRSAEERALALLRSELGEGESLFDLEQIARRSPQWLRKGLASTFNGAYSTEKAFLCGLIDDLPLSELNH